MTMIPDSDVTRRGVLAALGGLVATGTASAQSNETETSPTATPTPQGVDKVVQLGPVVTVDGWVFRDGKFVITISSDLPSAIKVTDTGAVMNAMTEGDGAGTTEIPTRGYTLETGKTTVSYAPVEFDGAYAITLASTKGAALLRTDSVDVGNPSVKWSTVQGLLATGMGGTGYLTFRQTRKRYEDDEASEPERLL